MSASRFEELPDDPPAKRTPSPTPSLPTAATPVAPPAPPADHDDEEGSTDGEEGDDSVWWTPSELRDILERATTLKKNGNAEFGQGRWEMALETYKEGLAELPVRTLPPALNLKGKEKATDADETTEQPSEQAAAEAAEPREKTEDEIEQEKENAELSELRAILSANVAACLLKLDRWKEAVKACDEALEEKADYAKALHRRAMANESIGSWGSLSASLEDFNRLSSLPPTDTTPLLRQQIAEAKRRLPKKIEEQQQKEKDEVLGKLKDLGNTVLGKFGLNLDNFKMTEQPGGGYSMAFQQ